MSKLVSPTTIVVPGMAPASAIACSTIDGCGFEGWRSAVCSETKRAWRPCSSRQWLSPRSDLPVATASSQPVGVERVEQVEHAVEQRLLHPARAAQPLERELIILGERVTPLGRSIRHERRHGFDQAEPDHPPRNFGRRDFQAMLGEGLGQRGMDGRAAVDQRPVAIENGEAVHRPGQWRRIASATSLRPALVRPRTLASMSSAGLCWLNEQYVV